MYAYNKEISLHEFIHKLVQHEDATYIAVLDLYIYTR